MGNEFDYSGLYHNTNNTGGQPESQPSAQPQASEQSAAQQSANAQPAAGAQPAGQEQAGAQNSYPNVGSSGMNTANTARTDYSQQEAQAGSAAQQQASQPNAGYQQQGAAYTRPNAGNYNYQGQGAGYTSTMHGGAANGYSYTSAPSQPQQPPKKKKKGGAKKVVLRVVACLGVVVLGFGGGLGGAMAASRLGLTSGSVVMQTVVRNDSTDASNADASDTSGSANGTALSTSDVAKLVSPSVVVITTEQMVSSNNLWFGGSYVQSGAGSGVIVSSDGNILTCAHVVDGATNIKVQLNGSDTEYTATVVGLDSVSDVAMLKIDAGDTTLTPAVIGDSDKLVVGEEVVAVGNPLGTLGGTVTNGIISALNRQITVEGNEMTLIQTNAAVSPGNSGGGLFNANGELVGIVNAKSGDSEAEGLGFAIPINTATDVAKQLVENGYVPRPVLGIQVLAINDEQTAMQYGVSSYGVYIMSVNQGSAAESAGMKAGDRIVSVDDVAVSENTDLTGYLQNKNVGDTVQIQVERDGKLMSFDVVLGASTSAQ